MVSDISKKELKLRLNSVVSLDARSFHERVDSVLIVPFGSQVLEAARKEPVLGATSGSPHKGLSLPLDHPRTVLAVKGSLRRAQQRRALDRYRLF